MTVSITAVIEGGWGLELSVDLNYRGNRLEMLPVSSSTITVLYPDCPLIDKEATDTCGTVGLVCMTGIFLGQSTANWLLFRVCGILQYLTGIKSEGFLQLPMSNRYSTTRSPVLRRVHIQTTH